jgi:hypothetical protein
MAGNDVKTDCYIPYDGVVGPNDPIPHVTIWTGVREVFVFPLYVIEMAASGEMPVTAIDGFERVIPAILQEWLQCRLGAEPGGNA